MNNKITNMFILLFVLIILSCSSSHDLEILHQVTGPIATNCYLLYDVKTKEAALFDVGGPIDSLESAIMGNSLVLKYIFITHAHCDHIRGLPNILKKYPKAKLGLSKKEYEDMSLYSRWESLFDPREVAKIKKYPDILEMMNFNFDLIPKPDIFLEDDQIYPLGNLEIRTFLSPGHSRGSMCFQVKNILFSGDVLFYRRVGRTDLPNSGGKKAIIKSVRRLYQQLPDETSVYPGHGQFTDIGSEKKENNKVTLDKVSF